LSATNVSSGTASLVEAIISDDNMRMAAAVYQVSNISGIVINWTNMTPQGGFENAAANIDTSGLSGIYTVSFKGMASAPKVVQDHIIH
jgi:uncharacterized protein with beta-barrel porin domain